MKSFIINNDDKTDIIKKFSITRLGLKECNYKLILDKFERYKLICFTIIQTMKCVVYFM